MSDAIVLLIITVLLLFSVFEKPVIKSKTRIEPKIEIVIKDGVPDTTFIYKN